MISSDTFLSSIRYLFGALILVLILNSNANSQDGYSIDSVDKKSALLFQNKKWDELITFGNKALKRNIETYFLRVRLGTAYFEKRNYFKAAPEFERALEIGYQDEIVLQYLYDSYRQTGRTENAEFVFSRFSESLKNRIRPLNNSFAANVFTGFEYDLSNDENRNADTDLDGADNLFGEQTVLKNSYLVTAGLNQLPFDRMNIFYGYSYRNSKKIKQIMRNNIKTTDNYQETQNRFYNRFDILAAKGFVISPAGHYINGKYKTISADISGTSLPDITVSPEEFNSENFILSLSASGYLSVYKFSLNGSFSYLNNAHQTQFGLSFLMYPSGKTSFYSNTSAVLHTESKISNLIFSQIFGIKAGKKISIVVFASAGEMKNYNEQNGYIIYNNGDVIKSKFGIRLEYQFSNNLNLNTGFSFRQSEKEYLTYKLVDSERGITSYEKNSVKLNYNVNVFSAGVNFSF